MGDKMLVHSIELMAESRLRPIQTLCLVKKPMCLTGLTLRQFPRQCHTMLELTLLLLKTAGSALRSRGHLLAENLVLRQQLAVLQRRPRRPRLRQTDR